MLINEDELKESLSVMAPELRLLHDTIRDVYYITSLDHGVKWMKLDFEALSEAYYKKDIVNASLFIRTKWQEHLTYDARRSKTEEKNLEKFYDNFI